MIAVDLVHHVAAALHPLVVVPGPHAIVVVVIVATKEEEVGTENVIGTAIVIPEREAAVVIGNAEAEVVTRIVTTGRDREAETASVVRSPAIGNVIGPGPGREIARETKKEAEAELRRKNERRKIERQRKKKTNTKALCARSCWRRKLLARILRIANGKSDLLQMGRKHSKPETVILK